MKPPGNRFYVTLYYSEREHDGPVGSIEQGPGKLGVIEEAAYADLLLIDGDPLKDISILTRPEQNLALVMKDGKIYKNAIK